MWYQTVLEIIYFMRDTKILAVGKWHKQLRLSAMLCQYQSMAKGGEPRAIRTAMPQLRNQIFLEIRSPLKEVISPRNGCTYDMDV